ncbi:pantoate--beta-alanine ligase [Phytomonospora endophytica]|uniref:Pantothenate synthetase n=1 Tax=Phytomonospora endophytica TaxID=714109 RepID=A0A841FV01_9ACTN|nr:pantoate--beta-alanine ligase [Phytomonospora endophytica]MBB6039836.1 pantoate--beta-alanine ligase [Phytomonospora endophytica]GIG70310.1 pantothenate synthetase [Phytomonospora endophytica]
MTLLVPDRATMAEVRAGMTGRVAVVMTMGALHEGHRALMRDARKRAEHLIVTVFVNPLQFGPTEDFDRYPRTLDADLAICRAEGVDAVFAPTREDMYPTGQTSIKGAKVTVNPGPVGDILEGAFRPGFFGGVLTVVAKLLNVTRPDVTCFGEKDYQQLAMVRAMAADLSFPVEVVGVETVREADGLAKSSRNVYLSAAERAAAPGIHAAMQSGASLAGKGATAADVRAHVIAELPGGIDLDYVEVTSPDLGPAPESGPARLLFAGRLGATRLIDNIPLTVEAK